MADQDDLLLLHHLRACASGDQERAERAREALCCEPGRAQGRVGFWAMDRTIGFLRQMGRRRFETGEQLSPNAQEARVLRIVRALASHNRPAAAAEAQWLVREKDVPALLDRLAPLSMFYAGAGERRLAARA